MTTPTTPAADAHKFGAPPPQAVAASSPAQASKVSGMIDVTCPWCEQGFTADAPPYAVDESALRATFEVEMTDNGKWPNAVMRAPSGGYLLMRTAVGWEDWKACAAALQAFRQPQAQQAAAEGAGDDLVANGQREAFSLPLGTVEANKSSERFK